MTTVGEGNCSEKAMRERFGVRKREAVEEK